METMSWSPLPTRLDCVSVQGGQHAGGLYPGPSPYVGLPPHEVAETPQCARPVGVLQHSLCTSVVWDTMGGEAERHPLTPCGQRPRRSRTEMPVSVYQLYG